MPLPELTESGDLPIGVHRSTLEEAIDRFGAGSDRRKVLGLHLRRVYRIAVATGHVARFVVFGSFITGKAEPNDVDVFMIMDDDFEVSHASGEAKPLFDHLVAQGHFGCSVFWVRRLAALGGEQGALEDWQIKRDGARRGIVEIIGDGT